MSPATKPRLLHRHSSVIAGLVGGMMLASLAVSVVAVLAANLGLSNLVLYPAIASFVISGWILAVRRPANAVGWLLLMTAFGLSNLPWQAIAAWMLHDRVGAGRWVGGITGPSFVFIVGGLGLLLPVLFPDGRPPSRHRWWRVVVGADVLYMVLASANLFDTGPLDLPGRIKPPNPFALPHQRQLVQAVIVCCVPGLLLGFIGSFTAVVVRWRTAEPVLRAQMKWALGALLVAPLPFIANDWGPGSKVLFVVVTPLAPIAIAVSVLRYRLYDIDRIVSRTVTYALITGLLIGVYVGGIALTTRLLPLSSSVGVAASTLFAAALFQPLRRRVQRAVDRRFNRERYDASRTVDAFAARLRDEVDAAAVRMDLLDTVVAAVAPTNVSLWVAS